ncbi:MAG: hypothetical protein WBF33_31170 [Candidatus Nitrosopolaris sp.]|jgi:hypothetical protein
MVTTLRSPIEALESRQRSLSDNANGTTGKKIFEPHARTRETQLFHHCGHFTQPDLCHFVSLSVWLFPRQIIFEITSTTAWVLIMVQFAVARKLHLGNMEELK